MNFCSLRLVYAVVFSYVIVHHCDSDIIKVYHELSDLSILPNVIVVYILNGFLLLPASGDAHVSVCF